MAILVPAARPLWGAAVSPQEEPQGPPALRGNGAACSHWQEQAGQEPEALQAQGHLPPPNSGAICHPRKQGQLPGHGGSVVPEGDLSMLKGAPRLSVLCVSILMFLPEFWTRVLLFHFAWANMPYS